MKNNRTRLSFLTWLGCVKLVILLKVVEEERLKLQADVDLAAARLSRAGKLTQALADEKSRWEESVQVSIISNREIFVSIKRNTYTIFKIMVYFILCLICDF